MSFIPHTDAERRAMLETIGVERVDDLYEAVPEAFRFPDLDLPEAISELEVLRELRNISGNNVDASTSDFFLGAGIYHHFIPSVVDHILKRSEFYTAYTPYQPEVSQGTLQVIFEFQSLICHLTAMEVANASLYDGATALAEAVNLALSHHRHRRSRVVLSPAIHPQYRETVETYLWGMDIELDGQGMAPESGLSSLAAGLDEDVALVAVQYPDFFGRIEDLTELTEEAHSVGALVAVVANPLALGLLTPPGDFGVDIVVGEGQPLGIPMSYGGPGLGIFATREANVRRMPGRLVGETSDRHGKRGYVLTLTPREQHIRRERATSNICTNQGLMALAATVYMVAMGRSGLRETAELCYHKAHYAAEKIAALPGFQIWSDAPFFNEFAVVCPRPVEELNAYLMERGIVGGYNLARSFPSLRQHMLLAVTEMNTRESIDRLVAGLEEAAHD